MKKTRDDINWIRQYSQDGTVFGSNHALYHAYSTYSVRKVSRVIVGTYGRRVIEYDVSKSGKRRSWYTGFQSFAEAKRFAGELVR